MLIEVAFTCAYCWEENPTTVDPTAGAHQQYVEDCQVCCRPNLLEVSVDASGREATIRAERESD